MATRPSQHWSGLTTVIRDGFTLIEVLVVVGILALLFAILLPSLSQARQQAARFGCASNLRTFGQALNLVRTERGRYPAREPPALDPTTSESLTHLGNAVVTPLVQGPLGRPDPMYCPTSLANDPYAPRPYRVSSIKKGKRYYEWNAGHISYIYLVEVWNVFTDANGQPTFNPQLESPNLSRSPRLVLAGDLTSEPGPRTGWVASSNHGREGGWFYFTTGDAQWWSWNRLTPHPGLLYTWYWPRLIQAPDPILPASD